MKLTDTGHCIENAYVLSLNRRQDKRWSWLGAMSAMGTPDYILKVWEGTDGMVYECREHLINEAIENGFDFYQKYYDDPDVPWFPLGDMALRYSLDRFMRHLIERYQCAAIFMDEFAINVPFYYLENAVLHLSETQPNFKGLILRHLYEPSEGDIRTPDPIAIGNSLCRGTYGTCGDWGQVLTPQGAEMLLAARAKDLISYDFSIMRLPKDSGFFTAIPAYISEVISGEFMEEMTGLPMCDRDAINKAKHG